jgi:hypothetical protein
MRKSWPFRAAVSGAVLAFCGALLLAPGAALAIVDEDDFDLDWDDGEIIVIELEDERTFDEAVLVAPDGSEIAAFRIDRDKETSTSHYGDEPTGGVGVGGGSGGFGVGVGIGIPLGGGGYETDVRYETQAQIRVPDMVAYRSNWRDWKLRIHLPGSEGSTGDDRTVEFRAPEPPH